MFLRRVFPRTWMLPEVRAFECITCGNACSMEEKNESASTRHAANVVAARVLAEKT